MTLIAVLALQSAQTPTPFFTNDAQGLMKLVGFAVALLTPLLAVVYKLSFNETREKMGEMKRDLDGFGKNMNEMALAQRGCDTEVGALKEAHVRLDASQQTIKVQMAEIRTSISAMASQQTELQRDIMAAITASAERTNATLTDIKIEVARLDERGKFSEAIQGLADMLRQQRGGGQ